MNIPEACTKAREKLRGDESAEMTRRIKSLLLVCQLSLKDYRNRELSRDYGETWEPLQKSVQVEQ